MVVRGERGVHSRGAAGLMSLLSLVSTNRIPNTTIDCPPALPPSLPPSLADQRRGRGAGAGREENIVSTSSGVCLGKMEKCRN